MKALFQDFGTSEKSDWQQKVQRDLKLDDSNQVLEVALDAGIVQPAYCDFSEVIDPSWLQHFQNSAANFEEAWQGARYWLNIERIVHEDPLTLNELALAALEGGADGVEFVTNTEDWSQVLDKVSIPHCWLGYRGSLAAGLEFLSHLASHKPTKAYLVINNLTDLPADSVTQLFTTGQTVPGVRGFGLCEPQHQSNSLASLAGLLSKGIGLINKMLDAGIPIKETVEHLQLEVCLGDNYLWEICRIRCLRILFHQILQQYEEMSYPASDLVIKATVQNRQGATKDPNHQMLRNTSQAMAAILGGCNLLTTLPHDGGYANGSVASRRVARNVGLILKEESYLNQVADPVVGSYYLESLTGRMLRKTWDYLQALEREGGYQNLKDKES